MRPAICLIIRRVQWAVTIDPGPARTCVSSRRFVSPESSGQVPSAASRTRTRRSTSACGRRTGAARDRR